MFFADLALARRLEAAEAAAGVECARIYGLHHPDRRTACQAIAGGYAVYAGPDSPLTQALAVGMGGPVTATDLDRLEDFYRSRRAPVEIELCPLADASLLKLLAARPYRLTEHSNVLVRALGGMVKRSEERAELDREEVRNVQLRRTPPNEVEPWARLLVEGFVGSGQVPQFIVDIVESSYHMSSAVSFLVTVDGQRAGGGSVATHDRVAALFGQSTLPAMRNRGVQTAVIRASLSVAAEAGCDIAMMCTLPGTTSQRNAERQGFRVVYTRSKLVLKPAAAFSLPLRPDSGV